MAAPTYFGSAGVPADNGTNATLTVTVTPPASMTAGDLVVAICQDRNTSALWSVGVTGGQTWNEDGEWGTSSEIADIFWCTFNGTWSADPRFDCTTATCTSVVLHVFRPDSTSDVWAIDVLYGDKNSYIAPATPFTVTIVGLTTVHADTVTLASFFSRDDNTWDSLTGTGWVLTGDAQYRNLGGSDTSMAFAHHLDATGGTVVPSVSMNQATLGGDVGLRRSMAWYAETPAVTGQPTMRRWGGVPVMKGSPSIGRSW